jgi:hypothetical protein
VIDASLRSQLVRRLVWANETASDILVGVDCADRIEVLGEAIGECARQLVYRRREGSRDAFVHVLGHLNAALAKEFA